MRTPKIKITNDSPQAEGLRVVIFQTAQSAGWKKVTAWRIASLPKGSFAEMEIPEAYTIALEYTRNEVTFETKHMLVPNGMGSFEVIGTENGLQLNRMDELPKSERLEVEASTNFRGLFELLIFKGAERIYPKTQLVPGFSTSPKLNGSYFVGLLPHAKADTDILPEFISPKVEVGAWDEIQITGDQEKGYQLKVTGKLTPE